MRRIMWFLLALSMVAMFSALGYRMAERDGWFDLREARVRGIRPADSAAVAEAVAPHFGVPLGSLDLQAVRSDLQRLPMVDSVRISRSWPGSVSVEIFLARPVAVLEGAEELTPVDGLGDPLPRTFLSDTLPLIEVAGEFSSADLQRLLDFLGTRGTPPGVCGMELSSRGISFFTEDCSVLLGSGNLPLRWGLFRSIPQGAILTGGQCTVDMRYRGQAIVRPLEGGGSG